MAGSQLLRGMGVIDSEVDKQVKEVIGARDEQQLREVYDESIKNFEVGGILKGRVLHVLDADVLVDVGYKSEGVIPLSEFGDSSKVKEGDEVEVLLEAVEDDTGLIVLSKRRAERIRGWQKVIEEHKEGDIVRGKAMRKIKGGLLVDIGVPVFLPASQVDIRRSGDIGEYVGKELECVILKIDESRRNIVVSRRKLLEERREEQKKKLLQEIQVGTVRKGIVKNIADFGVFVDLGGIDGLLHITDMSWGRISHPSEMVAIDDELEVVILNVDKEREKIALGLKQKTPSPWEDVEKKYPVGSRVKGQVVNIVPYGCFVKLEMGVEGLVHISEMSWTRRINHPSELVAIGDIVEVVVLDIKKDKEEISLGMKQTEANPWTMVKEKYPPGTVVKGRVRNLTTYGAFVELEEGIEGLLHVSDISWTKKVSKPAEVLKKGEKIEAVVLSVDPDRKRVALGRKQLSADPWQQEIPEKYQPGDIVSGTVTKIANFGAFVELEPGLEGLLHISELDDRKIEKPEDVIVMGQRVMVKVLRVDPEERKIGLSLRKARHEVGDAALGPRPEAETGTQPAAGPEQAAEEAPGSTEETAVQ